MTASSKAAERGYGIAQLQMLMERVGDTAGSWRELIEFLDSGERERIGLHQRHAWAMVDDLYILNRAGVYYTADYREVWRRLTGESVGYLPASPNTRAPDPAELQHDYFDELNFPATKKDVLRAARINNAPTRVMDRVEELSSDNYRNRHELMEALRDANGNGA